MGKPAVSKSVGKRQHGTQPLRLQRNGANRRDSGTSEHAHVSQSEGRAGQRAHRSSTAAFAKRPRRRCSGH
eukprot:5887424-Prymnesium_polylepis.1